MNHGRTAGRIISVPLPSCLVCHKSGHQQKHDGFHCARMKTSMAKHSSKLHVYIDLIYTWSLSRIQVYVVRDGKQHLQIFKFKIRRCLSHLRRFSCIVWTYLVALALQPGCTLLKAILRRLPFGLCNISPTLTSLCHSQFFLPSKMANKITVYFQGTFRYHSNLLSYLGLPNESLECSTH